MRARRKLTAARVRELLDCDPQRGILTWRERPGNPSFNAQWAGKLAGSIDPTTGYLRVMIDGTHQYVHRMVWLHTKGWLPSKDLDHKDGDKTNCAIWNLRPATKAQNNANRRSPSRRTAGPCGSRFDPKSGMYRVSISTGGANGRHGKSINLGMYSNPATAEQAYREAAEDLHREFALSRRPEPERRAA
jgi:Demerecviridae HNH endonuclease